MLSQHRRNEQSFRRISDIDEPQLRLLFSSKMPTVGKICTPKLLKDMSRFIGIYNLYAYGSPVIHTFISQIHTGLTKKKT